MRSFPRFAGIGGAREFAENLAAELTQGSQVPFLSPKQAQDALAIRDLLAVSRGRPAGGSRPSRR